MLLKGVEHAVNAGGRGTKETFHIALGWRFAMNNGVGINECQVLALPGGPLHGVVICRRHRHERGNSIVFIKGRSF